MGYPGMGTSDGTAILLGGATAEERRDILARLFTEYRGRLRAMVHLRLDRRLQARVDPSDVLQETFIEASRRLEEYVDRHPLPVFIWLRSLTARKLIDLHRRHLGAGKRSPAREVSLDRGPGPPSQTWVMAERLLGREPSPSQAAVQAESRARIEAALERMDAMDREVIALRHFERLSSGEAAEILGIREEAAKKRYLRAVEKLREILVEALGAGGEGGS
jgi:RNA polymerase sigma-70 factor, ECF subfamily